MKKAIFIILLILSATQVAQASEFPFTLHKLKSAEAGPTLLVIGGIQGDISYVPIKKESAIEFETNNPLVAIINSNETLKVRFGNRGVTTLSPEYFHYDNSLKEVDIEIDGTRTRVAIGNQ